MRGPLVVVALLSGLVAANRPLDPSSPSQFTLDLTTAVPESQKGRTDMPGGEAAWHTGQKNDSRYQLPLEIQILNMSVNDGGDFVFEVLLRNIGKLQFDIPSSRNLTLIEKPGNKSQRLFFFHLRPSAEKRGDAESIGVTITGGSTNIPNSFTRLAPDESLRVLLPVSAEMVKRAFKEPVDHVEARVVCSEWQLDDARYFIRASSDDAASKNVIKFVLRDGKPTALQP